MLGIDVSNNNGFVDWAKVARSGIHFAHAKATESIWFIDKFFASNRLAAEARGIPFGAYHFARPDENRGVAGARAEALHFCAVVGKVKPGELRPVLDLESGTGDLTVWAGTFLSEVERRLGVRPMLYTYPGFTSHLNLRALAGYSLWVADYGPNDGREHPTSVRNVEHQFTSKARIRGVLGSADENDAPSLAPLLVPKPRVVPGPNDPTPKPERKDGPPFTRKLWPVPVPAWFWEWAQWRRAGRTGARPLAAPKVIPGWAWVRLAAL